MNAIIQRLRAEVAADRTAFERQRDELRGLTLGSAAPTGDVARAAIALHHLYGAAEGLLSRVCRALEGALPTGPDWHQALLESMALDIDGVRPAVLAQQTLVPLRRLLAFRHFLRHAYAVSLDGERLEDLRRDAELVTSLLGADVARLDAFLAEVAARE